MAENESSDALKSIHCQILDECPDSVEWCQFPGYQDIVACGTYQLLDQDDEGLPGHLMNRKGSIALCTRKDSKLRLCSTLKTEAILDLKWSRQFNIDEKALLCSADAKGHAKFYSLSKNNDLVENVSLSKVAESKITTDGLLLSLDWAVSEQEWSECDICVSDSNGCLSIVKLHNSGAAKKSRWKAHEFEAWIAAFNVWDNNIVYSGGDDCIFRGWDTRDTSIPIFKNSAHRAGVCSVQCNYKSEHILTTGSYDEYIRFWDTRCIRRQPMSELFVGGGVWRLKWHPNDHQRLLAACMFNGFKVIDFENSSPRIVYSFNTNEGSLAYGVDWSQGKPDEDVEYIAGCTFYDRNLGLWKLPIKGS